MDGIVIEGLSLQELEVVAVINGLEVDVDKPEGEASEIRWKQAEQVAKALESGMTTRKLAAGWKRVDGTSYKKDHVRFVAKCWYEFGDYSRQDRPRFYDAYNSDQVRKPKQATGHPAKFTTDLIDVISQSLDGYHRVLDPFAGVGGIHQLQPDHETVGIELEPEWADKHADTIQGNALSIPFDDDTFDAIATSPAYGNRMADNHDAKDAGSRNTYKHMLGRDLSEDNSGAMQWGQEYRDFHERAWKESLRVLRPDGRFVLNISDHIRDGERQHVAGFHVESLQRLGLSVIDIVPVATKRQGFGENRDKRLDAELIVVLQ